MRSRCPFVWACHFHIISGCLNDQLHVFNMVLNSLTKLDLKSVWNCLRSFYTGSRIFVHGCAATPNVLLDALVKFSKTYKLHDVELIHILLEGEAEFTKPEYQGMMEQNFIETENTVSSDRIILFKKRRICQNVLGAVC